MKFLELSWVLSRPLLPRKYTMDNFRFYCAHYFLNSNKKIKSWAAKVNYAKLKEKLLSSPKLHPHFNNKVPVKNSSINSVCLIKRCIILYNLI